MKSFVGAAYLAFSKTVLWGGLLISCLDNQVVGNKLDVYLRDTLALCLLPLFFQMVGQVLTLLTGKEK